MKKSDVIVTIILILLTFVMVTICSDTSFIYRYITWSDVACFRVMGDGWNHGLIPYRDLFDHKGPFLYLIFGTGLRILPGNLGIYVFILLFNLITCLSTYHIIRRFLEAPSTIVAMAILAVTMFTSNPFGGSSFHSGGQCENFCVALTLLALIPVIDSIGVFDSARLYPSKRKPISLLKLFASGVLFGMILMIKFNLCMVLALSYFGYFLLTLFQKKFKDFFLGAASFIAGILLVVIPFVVYFYSHSALKYFYDCYIGFNFQYARRYYENAFNSTNYSMLQKVLHFSILAIALAVVIFKEKKYIKIYLAASLSIILGTTFLSVCYIYYFFGLLPIEIIGAVYISKLLCHIFTRLLHSLPKEKSLLLFSIVVGFITFAYVTTQVTIGPSMILYQKTNMEIATEKLENILDDDSALVCYHSLCKPYYELTNTQPKVRYFYLPVSATPEIIEEQQSYLTDGDVDAIIMDATWAFGNEEVSVDEEKDIILFPLFNGFTDRIDESSSSMFLINTER